MESKTKIKDDKVSINRIECAVICSALAETACKNQNAKEAKLNVITKLMIHSAELLEAEKKDKK